MYENGCGNIKKPESQVTREHCRFFGDCRGQSGQTLITRRIGVAVVAARVEGVFAWHA